MGGGHCKKGTSVAWGPQGPLRGGRAGSLGERGLSLGRGAVGAELGFEGQQASGGWGKGTSSSVGVPC